MRRFYVPGTQPGKELGMSRGERRRMMSMVLGLALILAMLFAGWLKSRGVDEDAANLPAEELDMAESVHVPEIDAARIDALVGDGEQRTRVVLEREGLDELLRDVRRLTPASFDALDAQNLDVATIDELLANPADRRGDAFRARGAVARLDTRVDPGTGKDEHIGLIDLEDGGRAWFLALEIPELGGFVRVDGLFLKNYRAEDDGGAWVDAPLLVAPRAERSYPDLGETTELDMALFAQVEDDVLVFEDGARPRITGLSFDALWNLMDFVDDLPEGAIDWANAPLLDDVALAHMLENGSEYRCQPFRIPISRLQGVRVKRAGENPARLGSYTEGWIGNAIWENVVHFKAPAEYRELALRDYMYGHGIYFKNFAYESAGKGLRIAPVLVLEEIVEFTPTEDPAVRRLAYMVAIVSGFLIVGLFLLVRRDRRRSRELEEKLLERKRKQRAQAPPLAPPVDAGS